MFIAKKRCGRIKVCRCADRRKQRDMYTNEDAASLTVSPKEVLLTSMIDAKEGRDVAIASY
eukprot:6897276-Ditylum_brightwellii.AAC.1